MKNPFMRYLYVQYQNPIPQGSKDIAHIKVFFLRCDANAGANTEVMTTALWTVVPAQQAKTRCVLKHKCPRTRPIPEVAVIVKTKIQGQGKKLWH
jgi:hypothetical protein